MIPDYGEMCRTTCGMLKIFGATGYRGATIDADLADIGVAGVHQKTTWAIPRPAAHVYPIYPHKPPTTPMVDYSKCVAFGGAVPGVVCPACAPGLRCQDRRRSGRPRPAAPLCHPQPGRADVPLISSAICRKLGAATKGLSR